MKRIFNKNFTSRLLLFAACVTLAVWLMPRQDDSSYHYEMGKPWTYPLLTAPTDIPVHLDSISRQHVRDSIDEVFRPVFRRDEEIAKTAVAAFATRLSTAPELGLSAEQQSRLVKALASFMQSGIVDRDVYRLIRQGKLPQVRFISANTSHTVSTDDFLSAREAYTRIDSMFAAEPYRTAIVTTAMSQFLRPDILIDSAATRMLYDDMLQRAMAPRGVIQQGERIIDRGDIVTPQLFTLLQTYERMKHQATPTTVDRHHYRIFGEILYVALIFGAMYMFLMVFRPRIFASGRAVLFIMSLLTACLLLAYTMSDMFRMGLYMVPFTIIPILIIVFFDGRTAFFAYICEILLCSQLATYPLDFFFVEWAAGVVALCSLKELSRRSQLVKVAILIFLTYSVSYSVLEIIQSATLDHINLRIFGVFGINAVMISFTYVLVFIVEKLFGFVSSVTLVELSDVNNPLLRDLSSECPGTFQHSMQVSNLAAEAAHRIGANVQLVRTGALYHDIGKIDNPAFFTENQHGVNPHDALSPLQSAGIVIGHVTAGMRRAEKAKLPKVICDFITQHHGRGKAVYFYNTYSNAHPGEEVDPAAFTYPGPNPQTREASILMMADAVEAASRSLKEYSPEKISELVNRLIDGQIAAGLHNESDISFRDVAQIKQVFIDRLRTIYHARVSYPTLNNQTDNENQ